MNLTTPEDLAAKFGVTVERLHELRKRQSWPHVRLGRFEIRFTDAQVEQIIATNSVTPAKSTAGNSGLTERSARRAS